MLKAFSLFNEMESKLLALLFELVVETVKRLLQANKNFILNLSNA